MNFSAFAMSRQEMLGIRGGDGPSPFCGSCSRVTPGGSTKGMYDCYTQRKTKKKSGGCKCSKDDTDC